MSDPRSTSRFRFSLSTLFLLTTIIALAIMVTLLWQEVGPLRAENKRLNEERGTLVIADESRVNAIRVPSRFAGKQGAFRVFIPEGRKYLAIAVVNDIPKTGFPDIKRLPSNRYGVLGQVGAHGHAFAVLPPGEWQIALSVEQRKNGERYIRLAGGEHGLDMTVQIPKGAWPEVEPETYAVFGDGVGGSTESVTDGKPLVLLRHRLQSVSSGSLNFSFSRPEPEFALDGMMLWIEPMPSKPAP